MFKVGDVVCLKSGSPRMTIIDEDNCDFKGFMYQVMWVNSRTLHKHWIFPSDLTHLESCI